jgi:hypothetical protein
MHSTAVNWNCCFMLLLSLNDQLAADLGRAKENENLMQLRRRLAGEMCSVF